LKAYGNGDEASMSRLSVKDKGSKKSKVDPKDICNYCEEPGHWKKDCLEKVKKDFVVSMVQNDSSSKYDLVLAVGEQPQQHFVHWVVYLNCSYHMCPHKSWFVT